MPLQQPSHHRPTTLAATLGALVLVLSAPLGAQPTVAAEPAAAQQPQAAPQRIFIREYRVSGAKQLARAEVERAVYPFLGPARTRKDVEHARAALEAAYFAHGYKTVAVVVPDPQPDAQLRAGIIQLQVQEGVVGRLRVTGARFSSPAGIAAQVPSLAEGRLPEFDALRRDFETMTPVPGRQVTPELRPGVVPGTVDVDLKVEERLPLTAGVELNNRYSADTSRLRLNVSAGATNLWQAGHALNLSYQTSPEKPSEVEVYSGYYLMPVPAWSGTSLMLQGTRQNSNVSTLGAVAVTSRGDTLGWRLIQTLPVPDSAAEGRSAAAGQPERYVRFYHSISYGFDYKRTEQLVTTPAADPGGEGAAGQPSLIYSPITHCPLSATYSATWMGERTFPAAGGAAGAAASEPRTVRLWTTELNFGATMHLRGTGSSAAEFGDSRVAADGSYCYLRADAAHTVRLPWDFQAQGKVQGQIAARPLISSEQFSGGGLGTVRGYLEAEASGDNAAFATFELRTPSLLPAGRGEWRFHAFGDWGWLQTLEPTALEITPRWLMSVGAGTRLSLGKHFTGSLDVGLPLHDGPRTESGDILVTFRAGLDY